jgi:LAS superfamily LD-carboxypeptidase LdcB
LNPHELTGRARTHLVEVTGLDSFVHAHVAVPFGRLRRAAAENGIDLVPASAFRDFDRQLSIWNTKYQRSGDIDAILEWSALPGASRHHWGTDLDLIDRAAMAPGYRVRLVPEEYAPGGPFAAAHDWLAANASRFGFFRPYRGVRSGVGAEPWHYSFAPAAEPARRQLTVTLLAGVLAESALLGKEAVLARLDGIHARYIDTIDLP